MSPVSKCKEPKARVVTHVPQLPIMLHSLLLMLYSLSHNGLWVTSLSYKIAIKLSTISTRVAGVWPFYSQCKASVELHAKVTSAVIYYLYDAGSVLRISRRQGYGKSGHLVGKLFKAQVLEPEFGPPNLCESCHRH